MTDIEMKGSEPGIAQIETQEPDTMKIEPGFIYEDPKLAPKKTSLERKLLLKIDILIVGMTSLVFLVNQWVIDH